MHTLTHAHAGQLIDTATPRVIRRRRPDTQLVALFHRVGHWAAARHCAKLGVPLDDAYFAAFGRYPRRIEASA